MGARIHGKSRLEPSYGDPNRGWRVSAHEPRHQRVEAREQADSDNRKNHIAQFFERSTIKVVQAIFPDDDDGDGSQCSERKTKQMAPRVARVAGHARAPSAKRSTLKIKRSSRRSIVPSRTTGTLVLSSNPFGMGPPSVAANRKKICPSTGAVETKTGGTPPEMQRLAQALCASPFPGFMAPPLHFPSQISPVSRHRPRSCGGETAGSTERCTLAVFKSSPRRPTASPDPRA
ncbi:hypothetical protein DdX_21519 [Ditylenchus destructor]|uniref:Uncharacterized protein n=1 Tax=Ditylenchus destructor TaxID=166010 RepID=A0AAD4MGC4_9BILA|nr:hypothetical protein DdX_21519 [Ditylenchus destructor]